MSSMQKLLGEWQADLDRWKSLDPEAQEMGEILDMMVGELKVTFTEDTMTTENYGRSGGKKADTYEVTSDEGQEIVMNVFRGERKAVFAIEIIDDQHINLRMREPKADLMVLKR